MRNEILDFKVFHGSATGENIYNDVASVLEQFKVATMEILDTIGVTDTTGDMRKMGQYCRDNNCRHLYCIDHNFNRNAQLALNPNSILFSRRKLGLRMDTLRYPHMAWRSCWTFSVSTI